MIFNYFRPLPPRLIQKIEAVQSENEAYAADELVELGEEILSQLAAMGIAVYLQQKKQKEVFNDFLISLFLSNGSAFNAGPLFRWAANMIKEAEGSLAQLLKPFFWEEKDGKEALNEKIHHLAGLRNAVMHGFFILPPERNREEAQKMELILKEMVNSKLFQTSFGHFHFINKNGFSGQWNILYTESWELFDDRFAFGKLAKRIAHEYSTSFRIEEIQFANESITEISGLEKKVHQFLEKGKGAFVSWYTPGSNLGDNIYRTYIQTLDTNKYFPIYYTLDSKGATFNASFLVQELGKGLHQLTSDEKATNDPLRFLKSQKDKLIRKPIIILHDVHIALFSPNHLTQSFNTLYDLGLPILATAWHYPYLNRFFNATLNLKETQKINEDHLHFSLENFLRFKGPNEEQEKESFDLLKDITLDLFKQLEKNKEIIARHYADEHKISIEYLHEAFSILSPFYHLKREKFKEDELDELYGFPKKIEESTQIYLSLGRRDVKLEYQHKVLSKAKQ